MLMLVDGDGVPDEIDQCLTGPSNIENVGVNGCGPPIISYSEEGFRYLKGVELSSSIQPINDGDSVDLWEIVSGSLPSGLNFDNSTGSIHGTPDAITPLNFLSIRAINAAGSDTATISIEIIDETPLINYGIEPFVFSIEEAINPLIQPISLGGEVVTWEIIAGILPIGMNFDSSTGVISGTPFEESPLVTLTVKATNSRGSNTANLSIIVNEVPPEFTYLQSIYNLTNGTEVSQIIEPINTGGPVSLWEIIVGSLPQGINFDNLTGVISGTPIEEISQSTLTIRGTNSGGSDTATISIQITGYVSDITNQDLDNSNQSQNETGDQTNETTEESDENTIDY